MVNKVIRTNEKEMMMKIGVKECQKYIDELKDKLIKTQEKLLEYQNEVIGLYEVARENGR